MTITFVIHNARISCSFGNKRNASATLNVLVRVHSCTFIIFSILPRAHFLIATCIIALYSHFGFDRCTSLNQLIFFARTSYIWNYHRRYKLQCRIRCNKSQFVRCNLPSPYVFFNVHKACFSSNAFCNETVITEIIECKIYDFESC